MVLPPIVQGSRVIVYEDGRIPMQLEVPPYSTLTERDIEKAAAFISRKIDPNNPGTEEMAFEGGRSIVIPREETLYRGGLELSGLQLSGVGFFPVIFTRAGELYNIEDDKSRFHHPNNQNLMTGAPHWYMGTSHFEGDNIAESTPNFRAKGVYTRKEALEKIAGTRKINGLDLGGVVTPTIEAVGQYLDPTMKYQGEPLCYIIFSAPKVGKKRVGDELEEKLKEVTAKSVGEAMMKYSIILTPYLDAAARALQDIHKQGAHLQFHTGNSHHMEDRLMVVDWATFREADKNPNVRSRNAALDVASFSKAANDLLLRRFQVELSMNLDSALTSQITIAATLLSRYTSKPITQPPNLVPMVLAVMRSNEELLPPATLANLAVVNWLEKQKIFG